MPVTTGTTYGAPVTTTGGSPMLTEFDQLVSGQGTVGTTEVVETVPGRRGVGDVGTVVPVPIGQGSAVSYGGTGGVTGGEGVPVGGLPIKGGKGVVPVGVPSAIKGVPEKEAAIIPPAVIPPGVLPEKTPETAVIPPVVVPPVTQAVRGFDEKPPTYRPPPITPAMVDSKGGGGGLHLGGILPVLIGAGVIGGITAGAIAASRHRGGGGTTVVPYPVPGTPPTVTPPTVTVTPPPWCLRL